MIKYKVSIDGSRAKIITARSELEARVKYCRELGLNYQLLANKIKAEAGRRATNQMTTH